MTFTIECYRGGEWREPLFLKVPGPTLTEAERAATQRSTNGLIYRVRDGKRTLSKFQNGKQLTKDDV